MISPSFDIGLYFLFYVIIVFTNSWKHKLQCGGLDLFGHTPAQSS